MVRKGRCPTAMKEGSVMTCNTVVSNIVVVPDLSATELTALAKLELQLTYLDSDYAAWDFYMSFDGEPVEGRGKQFEVMIWKPELGLHERISSEAVREHFRKLGFYGHAAAFTEWRRNNPNLMGYHASIPEDRACLRGGGGYLSVPHSGFGVDYRKLDYGWIVSGWDGHWSFVAFRDVS